MASRSFAAEFPNDNAALHTGTIWMSTEPCGPPEAHFSEWLEEGFEGPMEPIEIVDSIELEGPIEIVPAPPDPVAPPEEANVEARSEPAVEASAPVVEAVVEPPPPILEAAAEAPLSLQIDAPPDAEPVEFAHDDEASDDDPYAVFIRTLAEVAVASGATMDAATIDALLESDAVATAWRAILRGESEDFSKCAATLDEWAAGALASILSAPQKAAQLRRELRARGVAAFGLIDAT